MKLSNPQKYPSVFLGKYIIPNGGKPNDIIIRTPIEWLVLDIDVENEKMLLISKNCLDWECFEGGYPLLRTMQPMTSWEKSTIREMLNDEYYNSWFSEEEKELIILHKTSETTDDLLFLISENEINKYFKVAEDAKANLPMADPNWENTDESEIYIYPSCYWTRTVSSVGCKVRCVGENGKKIDIISDDDEIGVRPAMWIKYKAD